ncbi:MAG: polysaccharide deacetylase family protein [Rhodoferax sp.]|nr:polysaccharide deacetylase family protein [Rhodoferax sp.]
MFSPIPILLYHKIGYDAGSTTPDIFDAHMKYLKSNNIHGVSLSSFESFIKNRIEQQSRSVLISFDDGSLDILTQALPVLSRYNFNGVAFLISSFMTQQNTSSNNIDRTLTWNEARFLRDSGRFALQSHSHTHEQWNFDRKNESILIDELKLSRNTLSSELGIPLSNLTHLAWPWGRCNENWESIANAVGFTYQYLVQKGAVTKIDKTLRLPRLCCDGMHPATFARWMKLFFSPGGAVSINHLLGGLRILRHGIGYRN